MMPDSKVLKDGDIGFLSTCHGKKVKLEKVYCCSEDGWKANQFWAKMNGVGNCFVLVKA